MKLSKFSLKQTENNESTSEVNNTSQFFDLSISVLDLFAKQVENFPEVPACFGQSGSLSYDELDKLSNQVAHYLFEQGIQAEDRVCLYFNRSPELLIGILGTLKAGGCYVPLDPQYPKNYINQMIADANPLVILSTEMLKTSEGIPEKVTYLETPEISLQKNTNPKIKIQPEQLAYIMYTSGSTGKPKGVMVPHQQILNWLYSLWERVPFSGKELIAQRTSISFAISVKELLVGLLAGVPQVFIEESVVKDIPAFVQEILSRKVTWLWTFPSQLTAILDYIEHTAQTESTLKQLFISIEPCSVELLERVHKLLPGVTAWYIYGCTEMNDISYCGPGNQSSSSGFVPIGRPISNTRVYVLDKDLHQVPVGVMGDVYVESIGISRGYWGSSGLTAEKFLPNIYGEVGSRFYKSGDQARYLEDGSLDFLGRDEFQVKIRGYRVDLRQVEKTTTMHSHIQEAAVLKWPLDSMESHLVAYIVLAKNSMLDIEEFRKYLAKKLPTYMIPKFFKILQQLPRLPNGKLDRLSLPEPDPSSETVDYVEPRTDIEKRLAKIWTQVLSEQDENKTFKIGLTSNFFTLGGHSLLATQLFLRICNEFNIDLVDLPVKMIFDEPVLERFAKSIDELLLSHNKTLSPTTITSRQRDQKVPLSYLQERLWLIHAHIPDQRTSYNVLFTFNLGVNRISPATFRSVLNALIARHESLRTTFKTPPGEFVPLQVIAESLILEIPLRKVSEAEIAKIIANQAAFIFDLENGPLLNVEILEISPNRHTVLFNIHHIICDGWSLNIIIRDLHELYKAAINVEHKALLPLPIQYADYTLWQRQQDLSIHLEYWKKMLSDYDDGFHLPYDFERPVTKSWRAGFYYFEYPFDLAKRVVNFSQTKQVTLFMTLLASLAIVLKQYSGRLDICIGTTSSGREQIELEDLIGFFVNILALRIDLSGNPTAEEILLRVRQVAFAAYEHAALPFEHILNSLNKQRDSSQIALVPVMLRHQNFPIEEMDRFRDDATVQLDAMAARTTPNELDIQFYGGASGLQVRVEYAKDLFKESTIHRLIRHHQMILERFIDQPACQLSDFPILPAQEQLLLNNINNTNISYNFTVSLVELFNKQVLACPDAPACFGQSGSLSYDELDKLSNQVAHYLLEQGLKAEDRVCLYLNRSPELLIGILGTLKAGGCYVPLDPQYPQNYINQVITDANPLVILSTEILKTSESLPEKVIYLEAPEISLQKATNPKIKIQPVQLAYIMYTSGSTGEPKGVMVPHQQILNWLYSLWERVPFSGKELIAQRTSISFAISVKELLVGLLAGVPQVFIEESVVKDIPAFLQEIVNRQITWLWTFPSQLTVILDYIEHSGQTVSTLKQLFISIEPCSVELLERVHKFLPGVTAWYIYGCTEMNDISYCGPGNQSSSSGFVPIGRPISNTRVYVLDQDLHQVPVGVMGEVYVESVGISRGYWERPSLTAEKFIPNIYGEAGSRFYKPGDRARYLEDGSLEFLGRDEFQVKIRGYRVDLRQVEKQIESHESVQQAVVSASSFIADNLVAYIQLKNGKVLTKNILQSYLAEKLPSFMLPRVYTFIDILPKLPNGKIDRDKLPEPTVRGEIDYEPPTNNIERRLVEVFCSILKTDMVSIHDNFFSLGGHSLLAVQLIQSININFNINIPSTTIFNTPTVKEIAKIITEGAESNFPEKLNRILVPLTPNEKKPYIFCIPPIGGQIFYYAELAKIIGERLNVYGLMYENFAFGSRQELAVYFCDAIQSLQAEAEPYRLIGWSSGGLFALSMAEEFEKRNCRVEFVGLIDSKLIPAHAGRQDRLTLVTLLNIFATLSKREFSAHDVDTIIALMQSQGYSGEVFDTDKKQQAFNWLADYLKVNVSEDSWKYISSRLTSTSHLLSLLAGYIPERLPANTFLYKAEGYNTESNSLAGKVDSSKIYNLQGSHYTILQGKNALQLGNKIIENLQLEEYIG